MPVIHEIIKGEKHVEVSLNELGRRCRLHVVWQWNQDGANKEKNRMDINWKKRTLANTFQLPVHGWGFLNSGNRSCGHQ